MKYKSNISVAERVAFVNSVVDKCKLDNLHSPALYDFAFRLNAVAFFTVTDMSDMDLDAVNELVFSSWVDDLIYGDESRKRIFDGLDAACKEAIRYEREEYMEVYKAAVHPDGLVELAKSLKDIWGEVKAQIDPETIMKAVIDARKEEVESGDGNVIDLAANKKE